MQDQFDVFYGYEGIYFFSEDFDVELWNNLNRYSRQLTTSDIGHDVTSNEFRDFFASYLGMSV